MTAVASNSGAALARTTSIRLAGAQWPWPSILSIPGIPSRPIWPAHVIPGIQELAAAAPQILAEIRSWDVKSAAGDWRAGQAEDELHSGSWSWHTFMTKGQWNDEAAQAAPMTSAMLQRVPGLMRNSVFGYAFASTLEPGSDIKPHFGPFNGRLRVHIPLEVPSEDPEVCGLQVGPMKTAWKVGEPLLFDDSFQHFTWNHGDLPRTILLLDVWHPGLGPAEVCDTATQLGGRTRLTPALPAGTYPLAPRRLAQ